jgi:hypothetical protein
VAVVGKTTIRIGRTLNQTQVSLRSTGAFGSLNLSQVSLDFTVNPLLSADTAAHYIKAVLLAAAAQIP